MINFCTYFDNNYLARGLACYKSVKNLTSDFTFFILCLDTQTFDNIKNLPNVIPILLKDIESYNSLLMRVKSHRTHAEYYTTISPILPQYIFDIYKIDLLFYTDADIAFWSNPEEMAEIMKNKSIMVTDHDFVNPEWIPKVGRFNVGILGYKNDTICVNFLKWWEERCFEYCKWDASPTSPGKFADQGYLDILYPDFDKYNAISCPNPGVNLGPWNLCRHAITETDGKKMVDGKHNLVCYHYHEFRITGENSYVPVGPGWSWTESDRKIIYEPYFNLIKNI